MLYLSINMTYILPVKKYKLVQRFFFQFTLICVLFFAFYISSVYLIFAQSSATSSFSTKIVYKNTGLNIVGSTPPACIVNGDANDTCDFRIRYYSAQASGVLRGTEIFEDIEIGQYYGLLNLVFGQGDYTAGTCSSGECSDVNQVFLNNNDVHILVDFDSANTSVGSGTFATAETFSTDGLATPSTTDNGFPVRATPYSIWSNFAKSSSEFLGDGSVTTSVDLGTNEIAGVLGFANGGTNSSATFSNGSLVFSNGSSFTQDNSNLFYNDSTDRLGIGTNSPLSKLQINGGLYVSSLAAPTISSVVCSTTGGNLVAGVYYYRLTYFDGNGLESNASVEVTDNVDSGNSGSCTVTWSNVTGYTDYRLYRKVDPINTLSDNTSWKLMNSAVSTPYVDTGSLALIEKDPNNVGNAIKVNGSLSAVANVPLWFKSWGGGNDSSAKASDVIKNKAGNFVVTGDISNGGAGLKNTFIIELDNSGNIIWQKIYGNTSGYRGTDIVEIASGGYLINLVATSGGMGSGDAMVMKIDKYGEFIYLVTVGTASLETGGNVIATSDGGFLIVGSTSSLTSGDFLFAKYDGSGKQQWVKTVGSANTDSITSVTEIAEGGYIGVGISNNQPAAIKLSTNGDLLWAKSFGGNGAFADIEQASDGSVYIAGYTSSAGAGGPDVYIVQLSTSGAILQNKVIGGSGSEDVKSIELLSDGVYLFGNSSSLVGTGYLMRLDYELNTVWMRMVGYYTPPTSDYSITMYNAIVSGDQIFMVGEKIDNAYWSSKAYFMVVDKNGLCGSCAELNPTPGSFTSTNYVGASSNIATVGSILASSPANTTNLALTTGSNLGVGVYKYKVTLYGASGESSALADSAVITSTSGNTRINLSKIPLGTGSGATGRRIYRTTVNGDAYYRLTQIADLTTATYSDTISDATLVTGVGLNYQKGLSPQPSYTLSAGTYPESGNYKYVVTTYGADYEAAVSPEFVINNTGSNRVVNFTNIPLGGLGTTGRKIYRTDATGAGPLKLLTTIANNTTTTFTDNIGNGSLGADLNILPFGTMSTYCSSSVESEVMNLSRNGILTLSGSIKTGQSVYADTFYGKNINMSNFDLAEEYKVADKSIEAGDVVMIDSEIGKSEENTTNIVKSQGKYEGTVMGVISTKPGITLTDWNLPKEDREYMRAIGLVGRVPVKVSTENGPIEKGDMLVSGTKPGYAMKACGIKYCESGMAIGLALESFSGQVKGDTDLVKKQLELSQNEIQNQIDKITANNSTGDNIDEALMIQNEIGEEVKVSEIEGLIENVTEQSEQMTKGFDTDLLGEGRIMMYITRTYFVPQKLGASLSSGNDSNSFDLADMTEQNELSISNSTNSQFSALSGGSLLIGNGNLVADSNGNLTSLGVLTLGGLINSRSGDLSIQLGNGGKFSVKDNSGKDVFSVSEKGVFGGSAIKRSDWLKVPAGSSVEFAHNLSVNDIDVAIVKAVDLNTGVYTYKGAGTDYYWQVVDYNRIKIFNDSNEDLNIRVRVLGWEDLK